MLSTVLPVINYMHTSTPNQKYCSCTVDQVKQGGDTFGALLTSYIARHLSQVVVCGSNSFLMLYPVVHMYPYADTPLDAGITSDSLMSGDYPSPALLPDPELYSNRKTLTPPRRLSACNFAVRPSHSSVLALLATHSGPGNLSFIDRTNSVEAIEPGWVHQRLVKRAHSRSQVPS